MSALVQEIAEGVVSVTGTGNLTFTFTTTAAVGATDAIVVCVDAESPNWPGFGAPFSFSDSAGNVYDDGRNHGLLQFGVCPRAASPLPAGGTLRVRVEHEVSPEATLRCVLRAFRIRGGATIAGAAAHNSWGSSPIILGPCDGELFIGAAALSNYPASSHPVSGYPTYADWKVRSLPNPPSSYEFVSGHYDDLGRSYRRAGTEFTVSMPAPSGVPPEGWTAMVLGFQTSVKSAALRYPPTQELMAVRSQGGDVYHDRYEDDYPEGAANVTRTRIETSAVGSGGHLTLGAAATPEGWLDYVRSRGNGYTEDYRSKDVGRTWDALLPFSTTPNIGHYSVAAPARAPWPRYALASRFSGAAGLQWYVGAVELKLHADLFSDEISWADTESPVGGAGHTLSFCPVLAERPDRSWDFAYQRSDNERWELFHCRGLLRSSATPPGWTSIGYLPDVLSGTPRRWRFAALAWSRDLCVCALQCVGTQDRDNTGSGILAVAVGTPQDDRTIAWSALRQLAVTPRSGVLHVLAPDGASAGASDGPGAWEIGYPAFGQESLSWIRCKSLQSDGSGLWS